VEANPGTVWSGIHSRHDDTRLRGASAWQAAPWREHVPTRQGRCYPGNGVVGAACPQPQFLGPRLRVRTRAPTRWLLCPQPQCLGPACAWGHAPLHHCACAWGHAPLHHCAWAWGHAPLHHCAWAW